MTERPLLGSERARLHPFVVSFDDAAPRDQRDLMERPFFSLAKGRRSQPILYKARDVKEQVFAVPEHGMATIWDADVLIWAASQLVEATDQGLRTSRFFRFTPYQLLRGIRRPTGNHQYVLLKTRAPTSPVDRDPKGDRLSGHGMRVMFEVTDPDERKHTMTERKGKAEVIDVKALLAGNDAFIRTVVRAALQEVLEAEMTEAVGDGKGERTASRLGYRSGYYSRMLITRVGKLELRVPQDRDDRFSTELLSAISVRNGRLWRRWRRCACRACRLTEELCGHSFSASEPALGPAFGRTRGISAINKRLDESLAQFACRRLSEAFPYVILDA